MVIIMEMYHRLNRATIRYLIGITSAAKHFANNYWGPAQSPVPNVSSFIKEELAYVP
jgi:hypothetical protein